MMVSTENPHEDRPVTGKAAALSITLGILALTGLSWAAQLIGWAIFVDDFVWDSEQGRRVMILLPMSLLIGSAALFGLMRLKPWRGWGAPMSPATRRTNALFLLSGLVAIPGVLALFFGAFSRDDPWAFFSNSAISPRIAIFAIGCLLLSMAIAWWWYYSADEHERRANDVGFLAGGGLFIATTPVWWLAARGGLLPEPDAMILWCAFVWIMGAGWLWHRYR